MLLASANAEVISLAGSRSHRDLLCCVAMRTGEKTCVTGAIA